MDKMENPHAVVMEWTWKSWAALAVFPFLLVGACLAGGICGVVKAIREVE